MCEREMAFVRWLALLMLSLSVVGSFLAYDAPGSLSVFLGTWMLPPSSHRPTDLDTNHTSSTL